MIEATKEHSYRIIANVKSSGETSANPVLLEFKGHRRQWFQNPDKVELKVGEYAVVEADRGEEAGTVKSLACDHCQSGRDSQFKVLRSATEQDILRIERHTRFEQDALQICIRKSASHHLAMRLIDSEYRIDELKLTFYFTADGRIDFRELVRDLASQFRTRIELRQIGARDEMKRSEGLGVCGQQLCCTSFLNSFQPITTGMAKSQHLILNPVKLSGRCGRLKCCLAFEMDHYESDQYQPSGTELPSIIDPDSRIEQISD